MAARNILRIEHAREGQRYRLSNIWERNDEGYSPYTNSVSLDILNQRALEARTPLPFLLVQAGVDRTTTTLYENF